MVSFVIFASACYSSWSCFEADDLTYQCGSIFCCCVEEGGLGRDIDFFLFGLVEVELCPLERDYVVNRVYFLLLR